ncbi:MAG: acyltransferase [Candidatus Nanopelagicales bacterium]|nr:acyltransferase [Candidatus Nanopelagicales bacterium]
MGQEQGLVARVVAASTGRDRVLDAVKALALLTVIVGHSLAWHVRPDGSAVNVLEDAPELIPLTWIFQVLPLFFAAGAVSNAASLQRHGRSGYLSARGSRLLAPVVVYASVWTVLLLPFNGSETVVGAGRFLSQLLWFAGIYLLVAAAAVFTSKWIRRPLLTLGLWLLAILALDAVRTTGFAALGWLNMLLVWGWLHQVGYYLPRLRRRTWLVPAGLGLIGLAVAIAFAGPYSHSLISVAGDPGLSNLAPPTVVLAVYGAGQIMIVAGAWAWLTRLFDADRVWAVVALIGARGMGMYLWHIPLVGLAAGTAIATGWSVPALSATWWLVHIAVVIVVVPLAWLIAGLAARPERRLLRLHLPWIRPGLGCLIGGAAVVNLSVTGFATLAGRGAIGLPSSALVNLALVWLAFVMVNPGSAREQHAHTEQ